MKPTTIRIGDSISLSLFDNNPSNAKVLDINVSHKGKGRKLYTLGKAQHQGRVTITIELL